MEKIASFTIDHNKLQPGLYVSRKDHLGAESVTTFDLRITSPNEEAVISTGGIDASEHLGATYLRNNELWKDMVIYFGPMGCRTGFYLLLAGDLDSDAILPLVTGCFKFIANYEGEIPGATAKDCGNYKDMDLAVAKAWADRYYALLRTIPEDRLVYPE